MGLIRTRTALSLLACGCIDSSESLQYAQPDEGLLSNPRPCAPPSVTEAAAHLGPLLLDDLFAEASKFIGIENPSVSFVS